MLGSPGWTQLTTNPRKSALLTNFIRRAAVRLSVNCRLRRGQLFVERLRPTADDRILDLGGGRGGYMAQTLPCRGNVTIADLDPGNLKVAAENYGFDTLCLDGSAKFAVPDAAYDVSAPR
jgi:ubiquinone/menaquinone biosynthesis C-methylase UbiE